MGAETMSPPAAPQETQHRDGHRPGEAPGMLLRCGRAAGCGRAAMGIAWACPPLALPWTRLVAKAGAGAGLGLSHARHLHRHKHSTAPAC